MKISARNILKGTVKEVKRGVINNEIIIQLPGGYEITSIITQASSDSLDLVVGKPVFAVIKASNVMVAVDE
ncbi:MAG TPA: transporter [Desulfotomaculum sp.]|nr:transporter [Desulfotomaculum sp.]